MKHLRKERSTARACIMAAAVMVTLITSGYGQSITVNGAAAGRLFEGVGACSGGGATSVLLMSYPEPQRSQILDLLFKPNFGASMTTHFFEIGGDCNSTQSTEPSHMHTRTDTNFQRGWEWWIIHEAKKRNPAITLDGVAWGCPAWVGNGNFWTQDMCDYYVTWIKGLKSTYGYDLDAVGCKNESGENIPWVKMFKTTLINKGLSSVKLHAFDNWGSGKWNFCSSLATDAALSAAVDVIAAHTTWDVAPWSETNIAMPSYVSNSGKLLWDTEEHIYSKTGWQGYPQATSIINACNSNYISMKITKTVFWYLFAAFYNIEPYYDYSIGTASQPWSGHYTVNSSIWAYAHYNQFVKLGWQYCDDGCRNLGATAGDGTCVVLRSPDKSDFSIIMETKGSTANKTVTFTISGGLPTTKTLCVWKTNSTAQFIRQADITPSNGSFTMTIEPNSIYSVSTTTGQQKGSFTIPASKALALPYCENYDHYTDPKKWGYMPYYGIDMTGVFEITPRPDGTGKCLRQIQGQKANTWGGEWTPLHALGDANWTDYEVSADISFDTTYGWAGVMGRLNSASFGTDRGYYLRLTRAGQWGLFVTSGNNAGTSLASGTVVLSGQWHNVKIRFQGSAITGFINNTQVCSITNTSYNRGMAGLVTGDLAAGRNTALFDNLIVNTVNGTAPQPTVFPQDTAPPYAFLESTSIARTGQAPAVQSHSLSRTYKIMGSRFIVPKECIGKTAVYSLYDLKGNLLDETAAHNGIVSFDKRSNLSKGMFIVKIKQ